MHTSSNGTADAPASELRSLHLVDIENLVGDPRADATAVLDTLDRYLAAARWSAGDHMVVAANPGLMKKVIFDLPVVANMHCATGRDGADGKLLDAVTPHTIATRYDRLVIGSGDGIFMPHARTVAHGGVAVEVVARPDGCARTLHRFHCAFLEPVHTRDDIDRATDVVLAA